jgi:hypothetical protein
MTAAIIIIAVVVVVAVVAFVLASTRRRRHDKELRDRFGPEYDRVMHRARNARDGRRVLDDRQERREQLDIRPLRPEARDRYLQQWNDLQGHFVDDPGAAVEQADVLVIQVMRERGYPMDEFDARADLISVDHPEVVTEYRQAHAIALRRRDGRSTTEDLRNAVLHYRALFHALLETRDATTGDR